MERPSLVWVQCETILEDTIMKMFKKLMAIALAGVMALAVLTGCGSSLNEKELIKQMNDELKYGAAFGSTYYGKYTMARPMMAIRSSRPTRKWAQRL